MTSYQTAARRTARTAWWAVLGIAGNLVLPWLLTRAARTAERQDCTDCHEQPCTHPAAATTSRAS